MRGRSSGRAPRGASTRWLPLVLLAAAVLAAPLIEARPDAARARRHGRDKARGGARAERALDSIGAEEDALDLGLGLGKQPKGGRAGGDEGDAADDPPLAPAPPRKGKEAKDEEADEDPGLDYADSAAGGDQEYEDDQGAEEGGAAAGGGSSDGGAAAPESKPGAGSKGSALDGILKAASIFREVMSGGGAAGGGEAGGGGGGGRGGKKETGDTGDFEYDDDVGAALEPPPKKQATVNPITSSSGSSSSDGGAVGEEVTGEEELKRDGPSQPLWNAKQPPRDAAAAAAAAVAPAAQPDLAAKAGAAGKPEQLVVETHPENDLKSAASGFGGKAHGRLRAVERAPAGSDGGGGKPTASSGADGGSGDVIVTPIVTPGDGGNNSSSSSSSTPAVTSSVPLVTPIVTPGDGSSSVPVVTPFVDSDSIPIVTPAPGSGSSSSGDGSGVLSTPVVTVGSTPIVTPATPNATVAVATPVVTPIGPGYAPPLAANSTVARITIPSNGNRALVRSRTGELTPVTFDASTSSNADAFVWTVSQIRPLTQLVDLGLPFPEPKSFEILLGSGEYLVMLRVAGPYGQSTQQMLVTVQRNSLPVANAGGPYTGFVGRPVKVSAARSNDGDGDALKFRWLLKLAESDKVISEVFATETTFTLSRVGEYVLMLEADDGRGGVSVTQTDLMVLPSSMAPEAVRPAAAPAPAPAPALPAVEVVYVTPPQQPVDPATTARRRAPAPDYAPAPAPYNPQQQQYGQQKYGGGGGAAVSPYSIAASGSAPAQLPGQSVGQVAPLAPNKPSTPVVPQCLFDKATGVGVMAYDLLAMPPLTNLTAWASREWRDCSSGPVKPVGAAVPGGAVAAAAGAAPPALGALQAFIASPPNVVTTDGNLTAKVILDATGSQSAPLKPILLYSWNIIRLPDRLQVAATGNKQTQVWLHTGVYVATLTVTDLVGATSAASKVFAVWPVNQTTAAISSPKEFVPVADADATQVRACCVGWMVASCF